MNEYAIVAPHLLTFGVITLAIRAIRPDPKPTQWDCGFQLILLAAICYAAAWLGIN